MSDDLRGMSERQLVEYAIDARAMESISVAPNHLREYRDRREAVIAELTRRCEGAELWKAEAMAVRRASALMDIDGSDMSEPELKALANELSEASQAIAKARAATDAAKGGECGNHSEFPNSWPGREGGEQ